MSQNAYQDFRVSTYNVSFRYVFVDHFPLYHVKLSGIRKKVWIFCNTCLWSHAINLKLFLDLTTSQFIKALEQYIFEIGTQEMLFSDMGSQLVAGSNIIGGIIKDNDIETFL